MTIVVPSVGPRLLRCRILALPCNVWEIFVVALQRKVSERPTQSTDMLSFGCYSAFVLSFPFFNCHRSLWSCIVQLLLDRFCYLLMSQLCIQILPFVRLFYEVQVLCLHFRKLIGCLFIGSLLCVCRYLWTRSFLEAPISWCRCFRVVNWETYWNRLEISKLQSHDIIVL